MASHALLPRTVRSLAATVLVAAAGLVLPVVAAAPASAAGCAGTSGVTVVVDFHELGGGVQQGCAPSGGGKTASAIFPAAGFSLDYVQRQPSFVCRVMGAPSADPCVNTPPADAYWALYWSDGKGGSWSYASSGAGSLEVPDGGYVAFAWQGSQAKSPPGTTPRPRTAAPSAPTTSSGSGGRGDTTDGAKGKPGRGATPGPGGSSEEAGAPDADPSASPTAEESRAPGERERRPGKGKGESGGVAASASASPSPTISAEATDEADPMSGTPEATDPADDGGGVPGWVTALVLALLVVAGAAATVVRRRRGASLP